VAKNLQVLVSQLRKALGEGAISTVAGGYQLHLAEGATDVDRYEALLDRGRRELADGHPRDAQRTLTAALALWRGRAYEDVTYEEFARAEIERLEERHLAGVEARFEAVLATGGHADAVAELERFAGDHPLRERPTMLLMLALYRSGRQAEALAAYERLRRGLAVELGLEPGQATRDLHDMILRQDPELGTPDHPPPPPASAARRVPRLILAAGVLLLVAAAAAAVVAMRSSGDARLASLSGDTLGSIDPATGRIVASYHVGATPTLVASDGHTAWTLNADGGTVSRVDLSTGETVERGIGAVPAWLLYASGRLWVSTLDRPDASQIRGSVTEVDPNTLRVIRSVRLPGQGPAAATALALAADGDHVYVSTPDGRIDAVELPGMRLIEGPRIRVDSLAAGGGSVWVMSGNQLIQLDGSTLRRSAPAVTVPSSTGIFSLAYGHDLLWGAEAGTGDVWRIVPGPGSSARTIPVGRSALSVAYGDGAAWATSAVDGTVARIAPDSGKVTHVAVGASPQGVLPLPDRLLVTVAGGNTGPIGGGGAGSLATLPTSACSPVLSGGGGPPDVLIASDFDLGAAFGARISAPMVQAIEYTLRLHNFRAGPYRVAYQSCDDSTTQTGLWSEGKCQANAKSMVATPSVVGVVGTLNSGCAAVELPIMNAACPPLAMISPANSLPGLTKHAAGSAPDEPGRYYPSGRRTYARVYPTDDLQAWAVARMMSDLGVRRPLVLFDDRNESYEVEMALAFEAAARQFGLHPTAPTLTRPDAAADRALLRAQGGFDGVYYASLGPANDNLRQQGRSRDVLAALHARPRQVPVFVPDAYLLGDGLRSWAGAAASGVYITGAYVTDPGRQLPAAGREYVRAFSDTQPGRTVTTFVPYAAQATEVLLAAIAHSDGTREGVARELLKVHVTNGILGTFGFDRNGDITDSLMPVFRVPAPDVRRGTDPIARVISVGSAPS
jgi:branched-chain amino acid transport system substrate-binding protein